jgi:hypothetical protein
MEKFTKKVARELNVNIPVGSGIVDLSVTDRYSMFKAGPMLAVSVCIVFAHEARMPVLLPSAFLPPKIVNPSSSSWSWLVKHWEESGNVPTAGTHITYIC